MKVHLVDGTYELFRQHFGRPTRVPYGATRGVLRSILSLLDDGATHVGVATDHVIESFRNDLWPGYKTSAGMPPELLAQFEPLEDALVAMGVTNWAMVEHEADDALGAAAAVADADPRVEQVVIVTPDKDLGQCVRGRRVVQYDRRNDKWFDEAGVTEKFGVGPASIPDYLALVGDSADGFPGLEGWGAKSTAAVLARYGKLEDIPLSAGPVGRAGPARRGQARPHASRPSTSWPTCSVASPRSRPTCPSARSTTGGGTARPTTFGATCAELGDDRLAGFAARVASRASR